MSTPTRKPFLSDEDLVGYITANGVTLYTQHRMSPTEVRDKYEAHLAEKEQTIADLRARVEALEHELERILEWHKHETIPLRERELKSIADLLATQTPTDHE